MKILGQMHMTTINKNETNLGMAKSEKYKI